MPGNINCKIKMRTLLFCIATLSCFSTSGFYAQEQRHEFSYFFHNIPKFVRRFDDGRTLIFFEGESARKPNGVYFVVLKNDGTVDIQRNLNFPQNGTEPTSITDVQVCADSGFIVSVALGGCDYGPTKRSIQKFDKSYDYAWGKVGHALQMPVTFVKDTDENLIGVGITALVKYNYKDGAVIWKRDMVNTGWLFYNDVGYDRINNKLLSIGADISVWSYQAAAQKYVVSKKFVSPVDISFVRNIFPLQPDKWLAWTAKGIYFIDVGNTTVTHWKPDSGILYDFAMDGTQKAYALVEQDSSARLLHLQLNGSILDTLWESTDSLKSFRCFWTNGNDKVLAGIRGSGDDRELVSVFGRKERYNATGAYVLHTTAQTKFNTHSSNLAIRAIRQNNLLDTLIFAQYTDTIYNTKGGNFDLLIQNLGTDTVLNFSAHTSFNPFRGICLGRNTQHKRFNGLKLIPGDSVWVNFGDISVFGQDSLFNSICFWTSSPNNRPDIFPENDLYCHNARYNNKPDFIPKHISIQPNPASEFLEIVGPGKPVSFQVYDYTGHLLLQDVIPAGAYNHRINVSLWRAGMYYFAFDNQYRSFIIMH